MGFLGLGGASGSGTSATPSANTAQAYIPQAQPAADQTYQQMLQLLSGATPQAYTLGQNVINNPYSGTAQTGANTVASLGTPFGQNLLGQSGALSGNAMQTMNTAFDPQQQLYNQQATANLNNTNAINAMSGVAGTPYGAGLANQSQQNFNTNWLNQQLGRQATGLQAGGNALTQAGNLGTTGLSTIGSASGQPYSTYNTIQNAGLSALASSLGIPQQALQDVLPYLGLGQAASQLSGNLGQLGVNQLGQGIGGVLSALGPGSLIGGSSGLFGGGGLTGGIGSLLGGGSFDTAGSLAGVDALAAAPTGAGLGAGDLAFLLGA